MSTRLLNASSCSRVGALIHSGLHLLQELVDVHQVILGPQVWQWQSILVLRHVTVVTTTAAAAMSVAIDRNQRRPGGNVIGRNSAAMDGNVLQSNQSLSDLLVGRSINTVAFEVAKEIVQGIVVTLSGIERSMLANFTTMADRVIDGAVGRLLLRSIVAGMGLVVGSGIAAATTRVHMGTLIIVAATICFATSVSGALARVSVLFRGAKENGVIGVCLDMLLQVLWTLECLSTEVTFVRLQWDMDADVRSDVVTFDSGSAAGVPSTGQVQVVCALSSDVLLTDMVKESLSGGASFGALVPLAGQVIISRNALSGCVGGSGSRRSVLLLFLSGGRHGGGGVEGAPINNQFGYVAWHYACNSGDQSILEA